MSIRVRNKLSRSAALMQFCSKDTDPKESCDKHGQSNHPLDDYFFKPKIINQISFKDKLSLSTKFLRDFELGREIDLTKLNTSIVQEDSEGNFPYETKLSPSSHVVVGNSKFTIRDFILRAIEACTPIPCEYEDYVIETIKAIRQLSPMFSLDFYLEKLVKRKAKAENIANEILLNKSKPWIAIDLDETLIHSEMMNKQIDERSFDLIIACLNIGVYIRPFLKDFLSSLCNYYNIILFTAGEEAYAQTVVDELGIKQYFRFILSRDYCIDLEEMMYIKDLKIFGEDNNILLVDNSIFSFAKHLKHGVLVSSFYSDEKDAELLDLLEYLTELLEVSISAETIEANSNLDYQANIVAKNEKHFCFDTIYHSLGI